MAEQVRAVVVGSLNVDLHLRVPAHPAPGETVTASEFTRLAGGKGGNQAVALARLGAQVRMHACVGDDDDGRWSLAQLTAAGVDVRDVRTVPEPTGVAVVTVADDGGNRIVVVPGANATTTPPVTLAEVDVVVVQLEVPLATVAASVSAARVAGIPVVLNAAPSQSLPAGLLADVDVLVVNEPELAALSGSGDPARLARAVVVTLGAKGARVHHGGEVAQVPAPAVPVVDTTGAGDCFVGTLAYGVASGRDIVDAARLACVAAALSVRAVGARSGLPTLREVREWMGDRVDMTPTTTTTRPPA